MFLLVLLAGVGDGSQLAFVALPRGDGDRPKMKKAANTLDDISSRWRPGWHGDLVVAEAP